MAGSTWPDPASAPVKVPLPPAEDRLYPDRPIVAVGVVVWRGDQVLLIERARAPLAGSWSIPGGKQELGETVAEAGRREVAEETGIDIEITGLLDVVDAIRPDETGRIRTHYTLVDLSGEYRGGDLRAGDDASDCRWVDVADLDRYALWDETVRIIALARELRRGRRPLDDGGQAS